MDTPPPSPNPEPNPAPAPAPAPPVATTPAPLPPQQPAPGGIGEQQWIVFLHLSALAGMVIPSLGHILGPLIIWLVKKPESAAIDAAGRNVLNFQISWTIWMFVSIIVAFAGSCLVIPIVLPVGLAIAWIVFVILGAVKASNGETYKFPLTIKML
jgi:uncharacterized protein